MTQKAMIGVFIVFLLVMSVFSTVNAQCPVEFMGAIDKADSAFTNALDNQEKALVSQCGDDWKCILLIKTQVANRDDVVQSALGDLERKYDSDKARKYVADMKAKYGEESAQQIFNKMALRDLNKVALTQFSAIAQAEYEMGQHYSQLADARAAKQYGSGESANKMTWSDEAKRKFKEAITAGFGSSKIKVDDEVASVTPAGGAQPGGVATPDKGAQSGGVDEGPGMFDRMMEAMDDAADAIIKKLTPAPKRKKFKYGSHARGVLADISAGVRGD